MRRYIRDLYASRVIAPGQELPILTYDWIRGPGEIYALGVGVGDDLQWGLVTWRVEVDGGKVPDYSAIQDQIGAFDLMTDVSILIPSGARIVVYGKNDNLANALMGARFKIREFRGDEVPARGVV